MKSAVYWTMTLWMVMLCYGQAEQSGASIPSRIRNPSSLQISAKARGVQAVVTKEVEAQTRPSEARSGVLSAAMQMVSPGWYPPSHSLLEIAGQSSEGIGKGRSQAAMINSPSEKKSPRMVASVDRTRSVKQKFMRVGAINNNQRLQEV